LNGQGKRMSVSIARLLRSIMPRPIKRAARRAFNYVRKDTIEGYLHKCHGVIHVGANSGQERMQYDAIGLYVLWIEPIPEVFRQLEENIKSFPRQRAVQALLSESDGVEYNFRIANNGGQSSSIFEMARANDLWPDISFISEIKIKSQTLSSLLSLKAIDLRVYDALVLDTQGAELLVLKGCEENLQTFQYICVEAADFDVYQGAPTAQEISLYLSRFGFDPTDREHSF
jgi:FkbM family methyltransferase